MDVNVKYEMMLAAYQRALSPVEIAAFARYVRVRHPGKVKELASNAELFASWLAKEVG
jgi:hypothetical protein